MDLNMKERCPERIVYDDQGEALVYALEGVRLFGVSYRRVQQAVVRGELVPYTRVGTVVLLRLEEFRAWTGKHAGVRKEGLCA